MCQNIHTGKLCYTVTPTEPVECQEHIHSITVTNLGRSRSGSHKK